MTQQYRSEALEENLKTLHTVVEGVKATVIVNIDGLLVASYPAGDEENPHENPTSSPQVAAMSAASAILRTRSSASQRAKNSRASSWRSASMKAIPVSLILSGVVFLPKSILRFS